MSQERDRLAFEAAAAEAAAFLSINSGGDVSLRDYLSSVEIFASALGLVLPLELEGQI